MASGAVIWNAILVAGVLTACALTAALAMSPRRSDFLIADRRVGPAANAMATAAAALSATLIVTLANLFSFNLDRAAALVTGVVAGFLIITVVFAAPLQRSGAQSLPGFLGDRFDSAVVQLLAGVGVVSVAFIILLADLHAIGVFFDRFLDAPYGLGAGLGVVVLVWCAALGGMRAVTHVQALLYAVLAFAVLTPVTFATVLLIDAYFPQDAMFARIRGEEVTLAERLELALFDLGFSAQGGAQPSMAERLSIAICAACGVAVAPHVLGRFVTLPTPSAARLSAAAAMVLVAAPLTAAPTVGALAHLTLIEQVHDTRHGAEGATLGERITPDWFDAWRRSSLLTWTDVNGDGRVAYLGPNAEPGEGDAEDVAPTNEIVLSPDAFAFGLPSSMQAPEWTAALGVAGAIAAAFATALGALMAIVVSVSRDICRAALAPRMPDWQEAAIARLALVAAPTLALTLAWNGVTLGEWRMAWALACGGLFAPMLLAVLGGARPPRMAAVAAMASGFGGVFFFVGRESVGVTGPEMAGVLGLVLALVIGGATAWLGPLVLRRLRPAHAGGADTASAR